MPVGRDVDIFRMDDGGASMTDVKWSSIEDETREFLRSRLGSSEFSDTDNLFAGYVNSLFALQLVKFVENTFGIAVIGEDLELSNFNSVAAIARFVRLKREG
jgi:methoxymalonate biosynthesis acyl carrier protein